MDYQDREREINLKGLLFSVLLQWRKMIVFALILALLFGGFMGVKTWRSATNPELTGQQEVAYQAELAEYEQRQKSLQLRVEALRKDVVAQQEYLENSVLMNLDPWNYYSAKAQFYIETDYEILPGMAYQTPDRTAGVVAAYVELLNDSAFLSEVADKMGLEPRYLKELVAVENPSEGVLKISVKFSDAEGVSEIMALFLAQKDAVHDQIAASVDVHTIAEISNTVGPDSDQAVADLQKAGQDRLKTVSDAAAKAEDELDALEEPGMTIVTKGDAVAEAVKFGVVGAVAGCVLVALAACVSFIFGDKVYSADELRDRYGLRLLGTVQRNVRKRPVDIWLRKKEGRVSVSSDVIGANIRNFVKDGDTLLIAGETGDAWAVDLLQELSSEVAGVKLICGGNLLEDVQAIRGLPECDGVIFAVKCQQSRYSIIAKQLEYVSEVGKPVVGCIVADV